jgi:hypothetical protein
MLEKHLDLLLQRAVRTGVYLLGPTCPYLAQLIRCQNAEKNDQILQVILQANRMQLLPDAAESTNLRS